MSDPGPRDRDAPPRRPFPDVLRSALRLWRLAAPHPAAVAGILALTAVESLVPLASPWVIGATFDRVVLDADPASVRLHRLALYLALLAGVEGTAFLAAVARTGWMRRVTERLICSVRRRLHDHLLSLPVSYHDVRPRGETAARLLEDTALIEGLALQALGSLAMSPLLSLGVFAALLVSHPLIALLALAPVPPIVFLTWRVSRSFRRDFPASRDAGAALHALTDQVLSGIRVVQLYRAEAAMRERFEARQAALSALRLAIARRGAWFFPLLGLMTVGGTVLALAFGGRAALGGGLSPGTLVALVAWLGFFYAPLLDIARAHHVLQSIAACADRVFEVLDTPPAVADAPSARPLPRARGAIAIEDVTFAYPGAECPALRGVSLAFAPGEAAAIVGPSGSGKSSLLRLLPRLYDARSGRVVLDGEDVRELRLEDLRRHVALVPQEDMLIGATVRDAVCFGAGADDAALDRALRLACAADVVAALPGGVEARLDENGTNLSAGQRQRLAIARALLREPAVLALDEATSAIDPATEQGLWDGLLEARRGRTLIVVAHRPAAVRRFPRVVVIEDGRVTGDGPPDTLRATHPFFRAFVSI